MAVPELFPGYPQVVSGVHLHEFRMNEWETNRNCRESTPPILKALCMGCICRKSNVSDMVFPGDHTEPPLLEQNVTELDVPSIMRTRGHCFEMDIPPIEKLRPFQQST
jgi:hypothetical protein